MTNPHSGSSPYEQAQQNNPYAQQQPASGEQNPYAVAQGQNPYGQAPYGQTPDAQDQQNQSAPNPTETTESGSSWQPRDEARLDDDSATVLAPSGWNQSSAGAPTHDEQDDGVTVLAPADWNRQASDDGTDQPTGADNGDTVLAPSGWNQQPADDSANAFTGDGSTGGASAFQRPAEAGDPYAQQPAQDSYAQPGHDPYTQQPAQMQPYGQPSAQDPYGQPAQDPYTQPSAQPFGQPSAQQNPYGQPSAQQNPYGQPSAPYAEPTNPYGGQPGAPMGAPMGQPMNVPLDRNGMVPQGVLPSQMDPQSERSSASMAHWLAILIGFWGPLIVMLTNGDKSPWVKQHAKQSLNMELTVLIAYVIGYGLSFLIFPLLLCVIAWVFALIYHIQGAQAASRGETYKYPLAIQFLK